MLPRSRQHQFGLPNIARVNLTSQISQEDINEKLNVTVESGTFQNAYELSLKFAISQQTMSSYLSQIGKEKILDT